MKNFLRLPVAAGLLALFGALSASGYVYINPVAAWQPGNIPVQIKMGTTPTYTDGSNPSTCLQNAMAIWNANLGAVQFTSTISADRTSNSSNNINEMIFAANVEGQAFGSGVLAVTLSSTYPSVHERAESDILFNNSYTWDSYRGARQTNPDLRRVALHEMGHVLGLDHPDENGQPNDVAVMNSHISDTDTLTADDIAGGQSLYGAPGAHTPPTNDAFSAATTITLTSNAATIIGTNLYATKETGEPNHAGEPGGHSVWWKWTAPSAGSMTITADGSRFDTVMGVYTGGAVNGLTTITSNDDTQDGVIRYSTVTFSATTSTTYMIAVDGWQGESGYVQLNATFTPAGSNVAASITLQPSNATVSAGSNATFTSGANGSPTPTLRWQRKPAGAGSFSDLSDGGAYSGTTTATLTVSNATSAMTGDSFRMVATNSSGSATSNSAGLTVNVTSDAGRLTNLSVRTNAGTGDNTLLVGFVTGGSGTSGNKPLLIRGIGPTLTGFGVTGALADPTMDLIQNSATIQSNDDWGGNTVLLAVFSQVGAFSLASTTSKDSALLANNASGVYSVKITGVGGTTGIALAELYDATQTSSFSSSTPRLINVSARSQVGTGDSVLIAGFVVGGSTPCRVLIRGIGPTLSNYGVGGVLADPSLVLYQKINNNDTQIGTNDNWSDASNAATVASVSSQVGAFALTSGSKDSVLLVTLQPGIYSAKLFGVGNTTGVGLIEIYEAN